MMIKKLFNGILALFLAIYFSSLSYANKVDKIVAFGDSMTDNGNIYKFTVNAHKLIPLVPIIPKNPPYYKGRFSNGPIWIDNLAQMLNVPLDDYAYGGSWAEPLIDSKLSVPFGLDMQVSYYLLRAAFDFHKDRHLFVIWSGANDYINGRDDAEYATSKAVETIEQQIKTLIFYGAKNVYVLNIPDLGVVPAVAARGKNFALQVTQLSEMHNRKLTLMMTRLKHSNKDVKIIMGETTEYFLDIITNPSKYNFANITDPCYGGGYWLDDSYADINEINAANEAKLSILESPSLREAYLVGRLYGRKDKMCPNPDQYLFWDHLHPTRTMHSIVANLTYKRLTENGIE